MLSPLRNESENENKINQNSTVNNIYQALNNQICLKDLDFLFSLLKSTKFILIYVHVLYMSYKILVI